MNGKTFLIFNGRQLPNAPSDGIDTVCRLIETHSPELQRGVYSNDRGGCVLHYFGLHHPLCKGETEPGVAFEMRFGGKRFIQEWDRGEIDEEELLRILRHELARRERRKVTTVGRPEPIRV